MINYILKVDGKIIKIIDKNDVIKWSNLSWKMMSKMWAYKLMKKCQKSTPINRSKKWPKNQFSRGGSTGVKIVKNRPRGPGTPNMEFFEISHFFAKAPHFSTPKIDPYKWPHKFSIPHKNACTFRPRGV
jgi:hypothetical protein